jgi:hypothetical protein
VSHTTGRTVSQYRVHDAKESSGSRLETLIELTAKLINGRRQRALCAAPYALTVTRKTPTDALEPKGLPMDITQIREYLAQPPKAKNSYANELSELVDLNDIIASTKAGRINWLPIETEDQTYEETAVSGFINALIERIDELSAFAIEQSNNQLASAGW